jgi:hypothetical protein
MFKRSILLIPALFGLVALAGCSGGSSSGTSNSYAGVYNGTVTVVARDGVASASETLPYTVTVSVDGGVNGSVPGASSGSCNQSLAPIPLSGNTASETQSFSCNINGVTCQANRNMKIVFGGSDASLSGTLVLTCPGRIDITMSGYLKKVL